MKNITLKINGVSVTVPEGSTILGAAKAAGFEVPTLCYLKGICEQTSCRVCVVEVKGARSLVASCTALAADGMEVTTNSRKVLDSRKTSIELILSDHKKECLSCPRSLNCELQKLAHDYGCDENRYKGVTNQHKIEDDNPCIVRDNNKCVLCRRCVSVCNEVQSVGVIGGTFFMNPGGKGANQAVAVARLGGAVTFVCKTGSDIFGHQAHQLFEEEGINTSFVFSDSKNPSGVALITVDANAENCIVVASGANMNLSPDDLRRAKEAIVEADITLMQLEIPMETVEYVARTASDLGKRVILNPAPAQHLSAELIRNLFLITPNETEAEMISGIPITDDDSARRAALHIVEMGVDNVVITLGARGALVCNGSSVEFVDGYKVKAVDTTAAGDIFNGALAVALAENRSLLDAVRFACKTAAIAVTRVGAQSSAPYRTEVDIFHN